MKIYIRDSWTHAGASIYKGFMRAWEEIGYEVVGFQDYMNLEIDPVADGPYEMMVSDYMMGTIWVMGGGRPAAGVHLTPAQQQEWQNLLKKVLHMIENAHRVYLYVQPTNFPLPWGQHPNFQSMVKGSYLIDVINNMDHVYLWNWGELTPELQKEQFPDWKTIVKVPLAFDSLSYQPLVDPAYEYDVCYVGGWADNGFNEKKPIMLDHFKVLMKMGLKCGVFINMNISHERENLLLYNSKVALNIHDAYQRILGNDTNERTFKSLGLTGALVCDNIRQVENMFPSLPLYSSPEEMAEQIRSYIGNKKLLKETKDHYRNEIAQNHTYVSRVEQMRDL